MGGSIAMCFANAGIPVTVIKTGEEALRRGLEAAAAADIVVEAVFEEMGLKKEIFGQLDHIARPDAVLATNTSYLDADEIAAAAGRPDH